MAEFSTPVSRTPPVREDCWSEEATSTLIEAWGKRFVDMNRGNLRQKDWQDVADSVNSVHGLCPKTYRTDVQCKNRIDTVKKKFKSEKAKIDESNGVYKSTWRFFNRVEFLIGNSLKYMSRNTPVSSSLPLHPPPGSATPLQIDHMKTMVPFDYEKQSVPLRFGNETPLRKPVVANVSGFKRNYSVMAAAAAAAAAEEEEIEEEEEMGVEDGLTGLAKVIEGFGEVYERVESMKVKQMVELEKQRMRFAKDLEFQRMQMFVDMQIQLEKTRVKRVKRAGSDDDNYN